MTWLNKIWRPAQTIECSVAGPEQGEPPQILHVPDQPDGIKVLHDCPDAKIDVCFVHGLMGDGKSTWTAEGQSLPWPQTLLPGKLTEARILSFGYDADVMNIGICTSKSVLEDHAKILLNDLCLNRDRANASGRPIIFVAHSMGGLVVMNAILLSRNNTESHLRAVFDCARAVAFIATPHKGSFKTTLLQIGTAIAGPFRNGRLLKSLEKEDPLIENVQGRFWSMVRGKHKAGETFEVTCFYETKGYLGQLIVDKSSATVVGQHDLPIIADHINIVKFGSADDPGFNALLGELERWKTRIEEKVVGPRNEQQTKRKHNGSDKRSRKYRKTGSSSQIIDDSDDDHEASWDDDSTGTPVNFSQTTHSSEESYGGPFQASQDGSVVYDGEERDGFDEFTQSSRDTCISGEETSSDEDSDSSENSDSSEDY